MREKYVDERWPPAMVLGVRPDGTADVVTATGDIVEGVTPAQAERIAAEYNKLQALVIRLALAFDAAAPEAFSEFWYGTEIALRENPKASSDCSSNRNS